MLEKLKHNFRVTESQFAKASTFPSRQTLLQLKAIDARCRSLLILIEYDAALRSPADLCDYKPT